MPEIEHRTQRISVIYSTLSAKYNAAVRGIDFPLNTPGSPSSIRFWRVSDKNDPKSLFVHRSGRVLGANAPELPYYVLQCAHFCQNRARRTGCDALMRAFLSESRAKNRLQRSNARIFVRIVREERIAR